MITFIVLCIVAGARGHSWLTCTDYLDKNGVVNDHSKCRGWPRGANLKIPNTSRFGSSKGFDHKPNETSPCQLSRDDNNHYDDAHPMAVYYPGQQVVLAHPMKSHGSDSRCKKHSAVDTGNWIYRSAPNPDRDPTLSEFRRQLVFDLSRSVYGVDDQRSSEYPKSGFQNAPGFCEDSDGALGTYSFNVPKDLKPGLYTFIWVWAYKADDDLFSTCYEVKITNDKSERNEALTSLGISNFTVPCGGRTSNPNIPGSCSAGCLPKFSINLSILALFFVSFFIFK